CPWPKDNGEFPESDGCPLNEELGDPCTKPDRPCRGEPGEGRQLPSGFDAISGENPGPCSGCVCKPGFRRSVFGECVADVDCRSCWRDPFSDFVSCGGCSPVCGQLYPAPCPRTCSSGCYCLEGFVRSSKEGGHCVPATSCPPVCVQANMVFVARKSCFPVRCGGGDHEECFPYDCGRPGCECKPGYHLINSTACVTACPPY
ncbi:uncharacterized protein LOC144103698, partial [Amblyomma americanum]